MPPIPELEAIRKAQILEAALTTIAQKGIAKTTLDDVCRTAGLSKGGLVHYYRTKDILFKAVFKKFFEQIFTRAEETMALFDTPLDQILSFDWLYDASDETAYMGYPVLLDLLALASHDPECKTMIQDWIQSWVRLLGTALEKGICEGVFRPMDVQDVAQSISAIYQGVATRWYLGGESHSTAWAVDTFRKGIMGILTPCLISDHRV